MQQHSNTRAPVLTALGCFNVVVAVAQQHGDDRLYIVANIARLRQRGAVRNCNGDVHRLGQCLGQQRLATPGRSAHENVALVKRHTVSDLEGRRGARAVRTG